MDLQQFKASLGNDRPPAEASQALQALWHEAKGDWHEAHRLAQSEAAPEGAWVHAYLHRVEGDESNAAYWYRRADKPVYHGDTAVEWAAIVSALL